MPSWNQVFANFDKNLDHEEIDEFIEHLEVSTARTLKRLSEEYRNLSEDQFEDPRDLPSYQDHLSERSASTEAARNLGGQLSVVALYKKVESKTGRIIKKRVPGAASKNLSYFKQLCDALPFPIATVDGFDSFNELRLLNNSIKHGGVVSPELATEFPRWPASQEIESVGDAYNRLLPGVKKYVEDLVTKVYGSHTP